MLVKYVTVGRFTLIMIVFNPQISFVRDLMPFLDFFKKCISERLNKCSSILHSRAMLKIHCFLLWLPGERGGGKG